MLSSCRVFQGENNHTSIITLQTKHMRKMKEAFPVVLNMDATHNTNQEKYKPFSFMVTGALGLGQYVQHAIMENESTSSIMRAISSFKSDNKAWKDDKVLVVDKDFNEICNIKQEFKDATGYFMSISCDQKYLYEEETKRKYSDLNSGNIINVKRILHVMVYAETEESYERCLKYLINELGEENDFYLYFLRN